jgi:hypothetical protein
LTLDVVWWEDDPSKTRDVLTFCRRCARTWTVFEHGGEVQIVSPGGTGHSGAEHNEGYTACGIDATGDEWWWRT